MAVPQRLIRSLQRAFGAQAAEDLVNLLDGVELQRSELRAFRESMRADFSELRADFSEFRGELERQLGALRQEMTASHGTLAERIVSVESRLMRWSLVFWTGAVIAIAGLVIALR